MPIKKALVVDDSMSARVMLRRMLEQKQMTVDLAETAEEALEYLRTKRPDVVFMDHILPGMNGFEAAKQISSNPRTAAIPVIMYTSKEGDAYLEQARAHGAAGILRKPAKASALTQILEELERVAAPAPPVEEVPMEQAPAPAAVPPPEVPQLGITISTVEIENIARRIAQAVVGEAMRTALGERVEEQLARWRQDLLNRSKNAAREVASDVFATRGSELSGQLRRFVMEQIADLRANIEASAGPDPALVEEVKQAAVAAVSETAAETATETAKSVARLSAQNVAEQVAGVMARQAANELYSTRAAEIMHQVQRYVHDQVAELKSSIDHLKSLNPALVQEVKAVARAAGAQAGADSAVQAAERTARQIAQSVAEQAGANVARRTAEEAVGTMRAELTRIYLLGGAIIALGGLAALLYFIINV